MARLGCVVLRFKVFEDVANSETYACCLVGVSRTNALAGRTYLILTLSSFVSAVEYAVSRQDEVCAATDVNTILEFVACIFEFARLSHKEVGRNHTPIADNVDFAFVEDT